MIRKYKVTIDNPVDNKHNMEIGNIRMENIRMRQRKQSLSAKQTFHARKKREKFLDKNEKKNEDRF